MFVRTVCSTLSLDNVTIVTFDPRDFYVHPHHNVLIEDPLLSKRRIAFHCDLHEALGLTDFIGTSCKLSYLCTTVHDNNVFVRYERIFFAQL